MTTTKFVPHLNTLVASGEIIAAAACGIDDAPENISPVLAIETGFYADALPKPHTEDYLSGVDDQVTNYLSEATHEVRIAESRRKVQGNGNFVVRVTGTLAKNKTERNKGFREVVDTYYAGKVAAGLLNPAIAR